ncbi:MAG TPA: hypothetical protein VG204_03500 [Terriglobia bacterium]|nr:hypothetical protein [Terriglobia bacterium]
MNRKPITKLVWTWLVVAGSATLPVSATILMQLSLEQMSEASTAIVRGRVVSQETLWNEPHTEILTFTTLEIENVLKGQPGSTVVVEQLGGTIGHFAEHVSGTVHFRPDVSYVLFLEPAGNTGRYLVVGMAEGAYRIYRDASTHQERVIRPFGNVFYGARGGRKLTEGTAPLNEFQQELTTAIQTPLEIPKGSTLAVRIERTESRSVGRLAIMGSTTTEAYPSPTMVVPVGSEVEGTAQREAGTWRIRWTGVQVRGARVPIVAVSEEPARESLGGRLLLVRVR